MENREELYDRTPFYMTYPIQNLYLAEMEYEKDMERMKELYPREVQQLVKMIEQRCDELEHEGSRMYDENPDKAMMEEEARRLFERYLRENPQYGNMMPRPETPNRFPIMPPEEFRDMLPEREELSAQNRRDCKDSWLCSLIQVIFNDEVYRRRCRNRRCRRWSM